MMSWQCLMVPTPRREWVGARGRQAGREWVGGDPQGGTLPTLRGCQQTDSSHPSVDTAERSPCLAPEPVWARELSGSRVPQPSSGSPPFPDEADPWAARPDGLVFCGGATQSRLPSTFTLTPSHLLKQKQLKTEHFGKYRKTSSNCILVPALWRQPEGAATLLRAGV